MLIVTAYSELYKELHKATAPTKQAYAEKWNCGYRVFNHVATDFKLCRERVLFWLAALRTTNSYIFFTGADVMLTNFNISPWQWLDGDPDFVVAKDFNALQCDVFWMKSNARIMNYLIEVARQVGPHYNEQQALIDVLPKTDVRVKYVNASEINCYAAELYPYADKITNKWAAGKFCLHLAALPNEKRLEVIPKYLELSRAYRV